MVGERHGSAEGALGAAVPTFERRLALAVPFGASRFRSIADEVLLYPDESASIDFGVLKLSLASPSTRAKTLAELNPSLVATAAAHRVTTHAVTLGDDALELTFAGADVSFVVFRIESVVEALTAIGSGAAARSADSLAIGRLATRRVLAALGPISVGPPEVTGTPRRGAKLTASPGTWRNSPSGFDFQWLRCDAHGLHCAGIDGAKTPTYAVVPHDVGETLRVSVTATNAVGPATAVSAPSAVVS